MGSLLSGRPAILLLVHLALGAPLGPTSDTLTVSEGEKQGFAVISKRDGASDTATDAVAVVLGLIVAAAVSVVTVLALRSKKPQKAIQALAARMSRGKESDLHKTSITSETQEVDSRPNWEEQDSRTLPVPEIAVSGSPQEDENNNLGNNDDLAPSSPSTPPSASSTSQDLPPLPQTPQTLTPPPPTPPSLPNSDISPGEEATSSPGDNTSQITSEIPRGRRVESTRASLLQTPRQSLDVLSMSERSLSLADFPLPPAIPSTSAVSEEETQLSGDLGGTGNPPVSNDAEPAVVAEQSVSDSPVSSRPPTYHRSWRRSTPSQASFVTLPLYEDGDGPLSRAPSYRSTRSARSTSTVAGPRTPRTPRVTVRPPLPNPPSSFPLEKLP